MAVGTWQIVCQICFSQPKQVAENACCLSSCVMRSGSKTSTCWGLQILQPAPKGGVDTPRPQLAVLRIKLLSDSVLPVQLYCLARTEGPAQGKELSVHTGFLWLEHSHLCFDYLTSQNGDLRGSKFLCCSRAGWYFGTEVNGAVNLEDGEN